MVSDCFNKNIWGKWTRQFRYFMFLFPIKANFKSLPELIFILCKLATEYFDIFFALHFNIFMWKLEKQTAVE